MLARVPPRSHRKTTAIAALVIGALVAWYSQHSRKSAAAPAARQEIPSRSGERPQADESPRNPAARADFDFYLLALSMHSTFCADHERLAECRMEAAPPLVIHGLWPERRQSGAYPHDCPAPRLNLAPALARELEELMPGMRQDLHEHEWREHGGCSGLDDDDYFRHLLGLARPLVSALRAELTTHAERDLRADDLRAAADSAQPGLGATLTFHCRMPGGVPRGGRPWLSEIRQCVSMDSTGVPGEPVDCAGFGRRDQGCGASFHVPGGR
jgi:ribonuclease T2